jgi:hypothetical protein
MMPTKRDKNGIVIAGKGINLTPLQEEFLSQLREEGIEESARIARDLNYTSFHRDKRNYGTAFHRELIKITNAQLNSIEAAKGTNLGALIKIRDNAIAAGDMKAAMDAIKIINDMQGYKAPTKVEQTKFDIKATIDLTAPEKEDEDDFLDVDYLEE